MRNDLPHDGRFRARCLSCGAAIIFGTSSLRWCYEPAPQADPMAPTPPSLPRRPARPRWTGSYAVTTPVKKQRTVSA